ncbi:MAG: hypothetical protein WAT79_16360 [Saprospiraceae bacterium]
MVSIVRVISKVTEGIFTLVRKILTFIRLSFAPIVKTLSLIIIAIFIVTGIASFIGLNLVHPFISLVGPESRVINTAGFVSLYILIGIPVLGLIAFLFRIAFKVRLQKEVNFTVWTIWFIALFFTFYAGTMTAIDFQNLQTVTQNSKFKIDADALYIHELDENINFESFSKIDNIGIKSYGDSIYFQNVNIEFNEIEGNEILVEKTMFGRGLNKQKALSQISSMKAPFEVKDSQIFISKYVRMPKTNKWREHRVHYIISVPKNIKIHKTYDFNIHKPIQIGWTN